MKEIPDPKKPDAVDTTLGGFVVAMATLLALLVAWAVGAAGNGPLLSVVVFFGIVGAAVALLKI